MNAPIKLMWEKGRAGCTEGRVSVRFLQRSRPSISQYHFSVAADCGQAVTSKTRTAKPRGLDTPRGAMHILGPPAGAPVVTKPARDRGDASGDARGRREGRWPSMSW